MDSRESNTAVASTQSGGRAKFLRTTTAGVFWEDLTGNLPAAARVRGVDVRPRIECCVCSHGSRRVFLLTRIRELFPGRFCVKAQLWTSPSTETAINCTSRWKKQGYSPVSAPHRMRDPRVVSAADRVARAAAPGSLLSVIGARVQSARIGDQNAPVLAASDVESQIQVPFNTPGTNVQLATQTVQAPGKSA